MELSDFFSIRSPHALLGVPVPRLVWFMQELPSFVVSLLISLGRYDDFQNLHTHNKALIGCFLMHNVSR